QACRAGSIEIFEHEKRGAKTMLPTVKIPPMDFITRFQIKAGGKCRRKRKGMTQVGGGLHGRFRSMSVRTTASRRLCLLLWAPFWYRRHADFTNCPLLSRHFYR